MKAIFFDLDNTIYDAKEYYFGAFKNISDYLSKKYRIPAGEIYKKSVKLWEKKTSRYPHLFDDLAEALGIRGNEIKNIVSIFNEYKGRLRPYPDTITTFKKIKNKGYKIGVITDGNFKRQERKIKLLGIKKFLKIVIYTKKIKPKPSVEPFLTAIKKLKLNPKDTFYVADNPFVDFKGAKKIGMQIIRLKRGEFLKIPKNKYIDFEIEKLSDLLKIIK